MRKILIILALSAATVAASANDAFAQGLFRGRGLLGGMRGSGNAGNYYNPGYYGSGYYGSGYYGPGYYGPGYNSGYYGTGNYGQSYSSGNYTAPYYSGSQYYGNPISQTTIDPIRQSGYLAPATSQPVASVVVMVPRADAKVWFDGSLTSQQGMERSFHSPPLATGSTYSYTIRSSWMDNGKNVERERTVNVQPGQTVTVNFRGDSAETLQTSPRQN
jgi:uncharacterized protein (TIGR03000 family)